MSGPGVGEPKPDRNAREFSQVIRLCQRIPVLIQAIIDAHFLIWPVVFMVSIVLFSWATHRTLAERRQDVKRTGVVHE